MTNLKLSKSVKRVSAIIIAAGLAVCLPTSKVVAQSAASMRDECAATAQAFFRDFTARSDMQYNGQRTDGTHAVNGRIFLETRSEDFACSFNRSGQRMISFFAQGRNQDGFLAAAGGSSPAGNDMATVSGLSSNDVLNVRSGPGTRFAVVGALSNGSRVRSLECSTEGSQRWCRIQMMDDMRSEGWVNARYLTLGVATQLPEPIPNRPAAGQSTTVRVKFAPGAHGTTMNANLSPGSSVRYVLNARNGQFLTVDIGSNRPDVSYQIFNPNKTFLLDQIPIRQNYKGQLWQTGDHVVEVINRGNRAAAVNVTLGIR